MVYDGTGMICPIITTKLNCCADNEKSNISMETLLGTI